jgi:hypothetical protein
MLTLKTFYLNLYAILTHQPQVHQGYFDILFPTDFEIVQQIYTGMTGKFARTYSHQDFMSGRADIVETQTRNGENPLLSWYKNASVMITI